MDKPINCFPGYTFEYSKKDNQWHNMYRGVDLSKGGWVYSEPGIYTNVALLDIASMHPSSIILLNKLGKYTQRYADLKNARVFIKHRDFESAGKLFDGKLKKYLTDEESADALSAALKLPLNAFFGQSFATYDNPAKDSRDKNNIIALRGSLFMKTLFDEIANRGFKVIHNKTDSCKVPNATPEIIKFIQEFSKEYGYEMEHEATYERICLIDDAQYIATFMQPEECEKRYGYIPSDNAKHFKKNAHPWTATGKEFQRPVIFKSLFSGEPISFEDRCETKTVKNAAIYLDKNEGYPNVIQYEKEYARRCHNAEFPDDKLKLDKSLSSYTDEQLEREIANGHNYLFIGRVGQFCPVKPNTGGGWLVVYRNGKYDSVSGSKNFRWQEAEIIKELKKEDDLDPRYYDEEIQSSIKKINKFGPYERFIDLSKPYTPPDPEPAEEDDDPPWATLPPIVPCGDGKFNTCLECPFCKDDVCGKGYSLASYVEHGGEENDTKAVD